MSHVPVKYLDKLNRLAGQLRILRYQIEDRDPNIGVLLEDIERRLDAIVMMVNRTGEEREKYLAQAL